MKTRRNDPCPCGSGRKFKRCCIRDTRPADASQVKGAHQPELAPDRFYAQILDLEAKRRIIVTDDVLFNQLRRDCPRIAKAFDSMCCQDLEALNQEVCHLTATLAAVATRLPHARFDLDLCTTCFALLDNSTHTFLAAVELTRRGFRLQPGILIRSILESVSTVLHVVINKSDLEKLKNGKLSSTRTIASAKKILPVFGPFYGQLSKSFVHVGYLHYSLDGGNSIREWQEGEEALRFLLGALRFVIWSINVAAELAFFDSLAPHRFFRKKPDGSVLWAPTAAERERMEELLFKSE